eukprot:PhM_4_TR3717/c0_g2_i1/m.12263/K00008/SORD, gutB; L-iditol 2-dehydrogenase
MISPTKNMGVVVRPKSQPPANKQDAATDLMLTSVPTPPLPSPNEVTVQMRSIGICGSDVHYWRHGKIGDFVVKAPMVLGHESSGRVVAVGSAVTHLQVGDRVTLEPGVPCRRCEHCRIGRYNLCADVQFLATPPVNGSMAKYINHDAGFCFKLPDNVSYEEGAMCEPLSVGIFACQRAGVRPGHKVLVTGAGPIGLMAMIAAKAFGASHVTVTDIRTSRLECAKKLGADSVDPPTGADYDVVIECSGAAPVISKTVKYTKSGGVVVLVGMCTCPEVKVPVVELGVREVDLRGVFRYHNTYPLALAMISTGRVDVRGIMTHHYPMTERAVEMAFNAALKGEDENGRTAIKVVVNINADKQSAL